MRFIKINKLCYPLLLLLVFVTSCDEFLDEQPFSQTSDAQFWQNNNDAASGIAAIYDAMQQTYRQHHLLWGEMRSDNVTFTDRVSVSAEELITNTLTQSNGGVLQWDNLYQMIGRSNLAIQKIPQIPNFNGNLLGQAHILRAYAYFDAVRIWGAVPLYTEPVTGLDQDLLRSRTDAQVIMDEVIIPDMLEAERLITTSGDEFRFGRASVWAFQASVYMFQQDYEKAKVALDNIIALNEFSLVTTRDAWGQLFLNDPVEGTFQEGPELIFSIRYDILEDGNAASGIWQITFGGIPSYFISPTLENKWIEKFPTDSTGWVALYPDVPPNSVDEDGNAVYGDWRYFDSREGNRPIGEARTAKYVKLNYGGAEDDTNIPVYRYAGILLDKAIVENQLGNREVAIDIINQIRVARELPTVTTEEFDGLSMDEFENFILDERQLEMFMEGDRWWTLRAADKVIQVMDTISTVAPFNQETLLFPIFERHLIDNSNLTQNPGYGN